MKNNNEPYTERKNRDILVGTSPSGVESVISRGFLKLRKQYLIQSRNC